MQRNYLLIPIELLLVLALVVGCCILAEILHFNHDVVLPRFVLEEAGVARDAEVWCLQGDWTSIDYACKAVR